MNKFQLQSFSAYLLCTVMVSIAQPASAITLSLDDGTSENAMGASVSSAKIMWLNSFTPQEEITLTGISVAFGSPQVSTNILQGDPATVYLYSDPNNNGNLLDAVLEQEISIQMENANQDLFQTVSISPRTFSAGDTFFVGAGNTVIARGITPYSPAALDTSNPVSGVSWLIEDASGNIDPNNLNSPEIDLIGLIESFSNNALGFSGNWLVRAETEPASSTIPIPFETEATTGLIIAGGYLVATKLCQRQRKV